jgi:putative ABC transport system permease protein
VLETNAFSGRTLFADENKTPGRDPVIVLSHSAWQKRFGGAETVIGQTLRLNNTNFQIVGVMPNQFVGFGISGQGPTDVWLPLMMRGTVGKENADWFGTTAASPTRLRMYGRLKPGITTDGARAEINLLFRQLSPDVNPEALVRPLGITGTKPEAGESWVIRGVAMIPFGIVLLISCANIANLALARGAARRKEIGVRMSLGATRRRVVKQLMTESLILAVLGGFVGLLFAWWSLKALLLAEIIPSSPDLPLETIAVYLSPNLRVLGFTGLLSLGTTLVFGLVPALRATNENLSTALKDETSVPGHHVGRSTLRNSLVVGQLALCLMLLIATGLLVRGMTHLRKSNPIMQDPYLAVAEFNPELAGYTDQRALELRSQLVQRLKTTTRIKSVSLASRLPFEKPDRTLITTEGGNAQSSGSYNSVSSDYFETLGIPLIRGTVFTRDQLRAKTPVVVITESTAKTLWPNQDPLGQKMRIAEDESSLQVIGIAPDVTNFQSGQTYPLYLFLPLTEERQSRGTHILLRSDSHAQDILKSVRNAATALDSTLIVKAQTLVGIASDMDEIASASAAIGLAAGLASLALALSAVGLYGVMSYTVSKRTHEVGIRIALGAQRRDILGLIARQGFRLVGFGIVLGIAGGIVVSRVLSALLFGLSPLDPMSYISVSLFLMSVAALAMYIPARRATRIDPIVALRYE